MAQTRKTPTEEKLIKLRVVEQKYMESLTKENRVKIVVAPWENNVVLVNKKKYEGGETFYAPETQARALLETGGVQLASEKPKPFFPAFLEHKFQSVNGVVARDNVLGKIPTRTGEDYDAPWKESDDL